MMRNRFLILMPASVAMVALSWAQPATPDQRAGVPANPNFKTMHLVSNLGSYKLINGKGRAEMDFSGSLLVSGLKDGGTVTVSGSLSKQYDTSGRTVYFGQGKVIVTGEWRGIQCFGKKLKVVWFGQGVARISGEYDKNLNPGEFWFDDPKVKRNWPATGSFDLPLPMVGESAPPVRKPIP